jgi:Fe-S cluster biosynthesis and repair protein YggX
MTKATLQKRIEQWDKMTQQDPSNAMGWFSLGSAHREADNDEQAALALRKAIELDEGFSRAYQLLAQTLIHQGANEQAIPVLTQGYKIAAERGDVMPMRAMGSLLEKLNAPVPDVKPPAPGPAPDQSTDAANQIRDRRTNEVGTRMAKPPFNGPIGQFIAANYSKETWQAWIGQGTKVINELRLDFSRLDHQEIYDQYMLEWLGFTKEEATPGSSNDPAESK